MTVTPAKLTVPQLVENIPDYFMELEGSLLHSQALCPYPESDHSGSLLHSQALCPYPESDHSGSCITAFTSALSLS